MVALLKMPNRFESRLAERRMFPRKEVHCRVQGKRTDHSLDALRAPYLSLYTRDISLGGLSAISDHPLDPGEHLSVFFPPEGGQRGWDAYGRVIRCNQSALGWQVAVEFDPLPAA